MTRIGLDLDLLFWRTGQAGDSSAPVHIPANMGGMSGNLALSNSLERSVQLDGSIGGLSGEAFLNSPDASLSLSGFIGGTDGQVTLKALQEGAIVLNGPMGGMMGSVSLSPVKNVDVTAPMGGMSGEVTLSKLSSVSINALMGGAQGDLELVVAKATLNIAANMGGTAGNLVLASPQLVVFRPTTSLDDGYIRGSDASIFARQAAFLQVNDTGSNTWDTEAFCLLTIQTGASLPQGTAISKAELVLTKYGGASGAVNTHFTFQNADNATQPNSRADLLGRTYLTPLSLSPGTTWNTGDTRRFNVTSLVQTIVNRPGYNSGKLLWFWRVIDTGWNGNNNNYQVHSFDGSPTFAPRLEVSF